MNWLAHIYLADDNEEDILGNFLGDFPVNAEWRTIFSAAIQDGIKAHFEVDKFSTMHKVFNRSCLRIAPRYSEYSTILIDIFYDHFLARNWPVYSNSGLTEYTEKFYAILKKYRAILPPRLRQILPQLVKENWLASYRDYRGIQQALHRLAQRMLHGGMRHAGTLVDGICELENNYTGLETDFHVIINELKTFIAAYRNNTLQDNSTTS